MLDPFAIDFNEVDTVCSPGTKINGKFPDAGANDEFPAVENANAHWPVPLSAVNCISATAQSGVNDVRVTGKPEVVVTTIFAGARYPRLLGTFRVSIFPFSVTTTVSVGNAGAATPALKVIGRNLSSDKSVVARWSNRKKRPHELVVQSTVTPLPVIELTTLMAMAPVGLVVPAPPAAVIQSWVASLHVTGRADPTGAMHWARYIPDLVGNLVNPPFTVAPAGSRLVSGELENTNVSAWAGAVAATGIAKPITRANCINLLLNISLLYIFIFVLSFIISW